MDEFEFQYFVEELWAEGDWIGIFFAYLHKFLCAILGTGERDG